MLEEFIKYLEEQAANRSIYVWGGQGQGYPLVNESWIAKKETGKNREKVLNLYKKAAEDGFAEKLRAFDCSGLGMYWLQNIKNIFPSDMTAHGMMGKCMPLKKEELKKGDWVFRTYKSGSKKGRAYHIGFITDDGLNVIEAKGRAYGVIKAPFDDKYWNTYARPVCFAEEILKTTGDVIPLNAARSMKYGDLGRDVMHLQSAVNTDPDGNFGSKTRAAVKAFQRAHGLKTDGIAGINTVTVLKGRWKRPDVIKIGTFNVKRGRSSKSTCAKIAAATAECDICSVQEVTADFVSHMAAGREYRQCSTLGNYGHAVITKLEPLKEDIFTLPEGGEKRKLHRLGFVKNGRQIAYYNTHIQFTNGKLADINIRQMKKVLEIIEADGAGVKILTGDFNCTLEELTAVFCPAGYRVLNDGSVLPCVHYKEGTAFPLDNIIIKGAEAADRWTYPAVKRKLSDHDAFFAEVLL